MASPTNYYVRPTSGSDTAGQGTSHATAYQTLDFALDDIFNTHGRDAANGDKVNISDESVITLSAAIDTTDWEGVTSDEAPLMLQGYTAVENDGGIAEIDCDANACINAITRLDLKLKHIYAHSSGSAQDMFISTVSSSEFEAVECIFEDAQDVFNIRGFLRVSQCLILDAVRLYTLIASNGCQFLFNRFVAGPNNTADRFGDPQASAITTHLFNIIDLSNNPASTGTGIYVYGKNSLVMGNSIYHSNGTGTGILFRNSAQGYTAVINNLVEGFSGVGGVGIQAGAAASIGLYANNKFYNNTTNQDISACPVHFDLGGNDALGASPFVDAANGDFNPVAAIKAIAWPPEFMNDLVSSLADLDQFIDIGAIQAEAIGGVLRHPGMSGGMNA